METGKDAPGFVVRRFTSGSGDSADTWSRTSTGVGDKALQGTFGVRRQTCSGSRRARRSPCDILHPMRPPHRDGARRARTAVAAYLVGAGLALGHGLLPFRWPRNGGCSRKGGRLRGS